MSKSRVQKRPVRYAVVGLGYIAQIAVLPAFKHARNSRLVALVSSDPQKLRRLGSRYGVTHLCGYEAYDTLLQSGEVDAVYIALPNTQHREFTERAARAGVHVLCEKPIAVTSSDGKAMITATQRAGVNLMIAYRLHFERATLEAMRIVHAGKLGELRFVSAQFSMQVRDRKNIRLDSNRGGGPLHDIGIYCINAARMVFAAEPTHAFAVATSSADRRFKKVPESVSVTLEFGPGRLASFTCSFGAADTSAMQIVGTAGSLHMEPAFDYAVGLGFETRGKRGKKIHAYAKSDQFAPELLHFSDCIQRRVESHPTGWAGLADLLVIEALIRSIASGKRQRVTPLRNPPAQPSLRNERRRPGVRKPSMVRARPP